MKRRPSRKEARATAVAPPRPPRSALVLIASAFALVLPLFMMLAEDPFREPKELLVRLEAIAIAAALLCGAILGRNGSWRQTVREPWAIIAAAAVGWSAVSTLTAANRLVSSASLAYITAMAVVFAGTLLAMRRGGIALALVPFVPAGVNTVVIVLQQLHVWSPVPGRNRFVPTGLVGNSGDTGCYLMVVCIAATALAVVSPRRRRIAAPAAAAFAVATVLTATLTAVAALAFALVVLASMRSFRLVVVAVVILGIVTSLGVAMSQPARHRIERLAEAWSERDLDAFFSFRMVAFMTAGLMAADHPVLGVGPGGFGPAYFEYRKRVDEKYEFARSAGARMFNFSQAHNDHLQVLAQTGLPGYLVFLAALFFLARVSWRGSGETEERRFAHQLGLPLAAGFGVLAFAQFPLELAAPLHTALYYASAAIAWSARP